MDTKQPENLVRYDVRTIEAFASVWDTRVANEVGKVTPIYSLFLLSTRGLFNGSAQASFSESVHGVTSC